MPREVMYTAHAGIATFSVANPNLDGSGSITSVITGAANGTFIKTVIIKAQMITDQGMVRFFVSSGGK